MPRGDHWTHKEDGFLLCPIPAAYLALGALKPRTAEAIRFRRRKLKVYRFFLPRGFATLPGQGAVRQRAELEHYPGVDWDKTLRELMEDTGLCQTTAARLRLEAGCKPSKRGPKKVTRAHFPGADWSRGAAKLSRELGVSIYIVRRLKREAG